ncbi:MAG: hypothetical protein M1812_004856 [Candelaria pacifica]|nr:MAG: hypothetical protein M1812_004856 [Candelaria pacifica]
MAPLGNLIRLHALPITHLPAHPEFEAVQSAKLPHASSTEDGSASRPGDSSYAPTGESAASSANPSQRPSLSSFLKEALDQATFFADDVSTTFKTTSEKGSNPATAKVTLLKRQITSQELSDIPWGTQTIPRLAPRHIANGEAWFARRSIHANKREDGTADFEEFERLRLNPSEAEVQYTPDVVDAFKVLDWEAEIGRQGIEGYSDVKMWIYEMYHHLPWPVYNRAFSVLVITAKTSRSSFIVVRIPLDLSTLPQAFYSSGRHIQEGDTAQKRKPFVHGIYTSIERVKTNSDQSIEWMMTVSSDANGSLPMSMQKLALPGEIAKDVGFFLKWIGETRDS